MATEPLVDTPPADPKAKGGKARRPKSASMATGKRSLNLSIPVEDYERLSIHALRADSTISELVSRLAREHLREYHLARTPMREG